MRKILATVALLAFVAGCGSDSKSPTENQGGSAFNITVGTGLRPTYSWPGGEAHSVSVVRTSAPTTIVWGVARGVSALVPSPVTHGTNPNPTPISGTVISASTEPVLTAGVEYRVSITLANGSTGWTEFTR